jgi:RHS repeat-associated protein
VNLLFSYLIASYTFGADLIAMMKSGELSNYLYDGLGSTRSLTDSMGEISDTYAYDAFGNDLGKTGSTENDYLYTGEQYDASLDKYYLRARYYDQGNGRFSQQDTWQGRGGEPITQNKYVYANSDSVNYTDPSGYMSLSSLSASMNIQTTLTTIARPVLQKAMNKVGCELAMVAAEEAITQGIYVLFDGKNYYTGQSNDIDRRHTEHIRTKAKKDMKVVARFLTNGGKDAMRIMEQFVMDALDLVDAPNINGVKAIDKQRGRLRKQYKIFKTKVCK